MDNIEHIFYHEDHGELIATRAELADHYDLHKSHLSEVINGKRRAEKGWMLLSTLANEWSMQDVKRFYLNKETMANAYKSYLSESVYNKIINNNKWDTDIEVMSEFGPILRQYCPRC